MIVASGSTVVVETQFGLAALNKILRRLRKERARMEITYLLYLVLPEILIR
jgi:hypothetical protein